MSFQYKPVGEAAILVIIGDAISPIINNKVRDFSKGIEYQKITGIVELLPSYADVLVVFNPLIISLESLLKVLKRLEKQGSPLHSTVTKTLIVPVCYEEAFSPDMNEVSKASNLGREDIIRIHSSVDYLVYMLGFTPGFGYLGGMDKRIATPRKQSPRLKIPAGAVGIAGEQTGIYPIESPGGWQIIGQTPIKMFQADAAENFPVQQGDFIRFRSISKQTFQAISNEVVKGCYSYEIV